MISGVGLIRVDERAFSRPCGGVLVRILHKSLAIGDTSGFSRYVGNWCWGCWVGVCDDE